MTSRIAIAKNAILASFRKYGGIQWSDEIAVRYNLDLEQVDEAQGWLAAAGIITLVDQEWDWDLRHRVYAYKLTPAGLWMTYY